MYRITIHSKTKADVKVTGGEDTFGLDLEVLKAVVPVDKREFDWDDKVWKLVDIGEYVSAFPELQAALDDFNRQMRFDFMDEETDG